MSEESSTTNAHKICGLCNDKPSKYCCPRCEVLYCSLECYKSESHSTCSESFYRDCVNEELASYDPDDESRQKMIDILKRMRKDEDSNLESPENVEEIVDSDDNEDCDLHDRLQGLNLDDADAIWDVLTEDERNEFEALMSRGDVGCIMPQWEPWWMYRRKEKLVQDIVEKDVRGEEAMKKCPSLRDVPKLEKMTSVQPSPAIRFNITNILASYAFIARYFNGELNAVEATMYLLNICTNLDTNTNFEDLDTALESVAQKCLQSDLIETDKMSLDVMKQDTFLIIQGPSKDNNSYYCKAALSHVYRLLSEVKSASKIKIAEKSKEKRVFSKKFPEHKTDHLPNIDLSKVKKCMKKVEFFLSFIECCGMEFD